MFRVLDKYFARIIISSILITIFILISLSSIIKFIEQLRKVGDGNYTIWSAGIFTLLTIPRDIEVFFPMAALLGVLLGLGTIASRNELVVIQAASFSRLQIVISVMKTAIPLAILVMVIGELVTPVTEQLARNYRAKKIVGQLLMITDYGLWAKDGNNFIHIQSIIDKNKIKELFIYQLDAHKKLQAIIFAASGHYNNNANQWQLLQVDKLLINNQNKITNSHTLVMNWKTNLNPEKLEIVSLEPDSLSIRGLYKYIQYLEESGQETSVYQLSMWKKILSPLSIIVTILVALLFILGPLRNVSAGVKVLSGVLGGFIFYLLNDGFCNLSLIYGVPAVITALLPSKLFFGFSILLLRWQE